MKRSITRGVRWTFWGVLWLLIGFQKILRINPQKNGETEYRGHSNCRPDVMLGRSAPIG